MNFRTNVFWLHKDASRLFNQHQHVYFQISSDGGRRSNEVAAAAWLIRAWTQSACGWQATVIAAAGIFLHQCSAFMAELTAFKAAVSAFHDGIVAPMQFSRLPSFSDGHLLETGGNLPILELSVSHLDVA